MKCKAMGCGNAGRGRVTMLFGSEPCAECGGTGEIENGGGGVLGNYVTLNVTLPDSAPIMSDGPVPIDVELEHARAMNPYDTIMRHPVSKVLWIKGFGPPSTWTLEHRDLMLHEVYRSPELCRFWCDLTAMTIVDLLEALADTA